ncbi:hypothetical protein B0A55_09278 [Friedmanniomyces simplex]|uniref:Uncharacterized protein n=1 Tax=Friedmanniomyces simplex TaxID=329884 RepID=A0A4V5NGC0_9PEZI|nr:hypothetical protein B0A55_09278 [Friedmanniomyces simplex]
MGQRLVEASDGLLPLEIGLPDETEQDVRTQVRTRVVERFRHNVDYNKLQRTIPELPLLTQARADAVIQSNVCFPEPSKATTLAEQAVKRILEEMPQLAHSNDTMDQEQLRRLSSDLSTLTASIQLQERSIEEGRNKEADDDPLRYFVHFMSKDVADSDLSDMTCGVLLNKGVNGPSRYRSGTGAEPIVNPNKYEKVM